MINTKADTTNKGITATVRWRLKSLKAALLLVSLSSWVTNRIVITSIATKPAMAGPAVAVTTVQTMSLRTF